jgi:hypothetical protein
MMKNIESAAADAQRLKSKLSALVARRDRLNVLIQDYSQQYASLISVLAKTNADKTYQGLSLSEAILKCLALSKGVCSPSEITHRLIGGGYVFESRSPYQSVYVICSKLFARGLIESTTEQGRRVFSKK